MNIQDINICYSGHLESYQSEKIKFFVLWPDDGPSLVPKLDTV